jgi:Na+-transporting NADH:ubiquinone oxidoreductase subunit NqrE
MKRVLWATGLGIYVAIYALGAAVWLYFAVLNPGAVRSAADMSFVPLVPWIFHNVVGAAPSAWAFIIALGELSLAALLVTRRYRVAALVLATLWQVFGAGLAVGWPLGIINLLLAAGQIVLLIQYGRHAPPAGHQLRAAA